MGHKSIRKIIILIACFALTGIFIYLQPETTASLKKTPLHQALLEIKGWKNFGFSPFDPEIVEALKLDDYVNQQYSNGSSSVFLYIGYYFTTKKVGAAHDPLVCFPGQGWMLSGKEKSKLILDTETGESISYSMMIAHRRQQTELIIYWFQSYDQTSPDTFSQKIASFVNKIYNSGEDNAFVRITMPVGEKSISECRETIFNFIRAFYPVFLNYIKEDKK